MAPATLHLLHLVSPALPIGAYAYSQGLEYAVDSGLIRGEAQLQDWLEGVLDCGLGHLDLPVLLRCMDAWEAGDGGALNRWNEWVRASRETHELLLEDEQLGLALARLLGSLLGEPDTGPLRESPCYATQFARAAVHWGVPRADALQGMAWSWLENQIAAATKLIPLGQTQAQTLLVRMMPAIPPVCDRARQLDDESLGLGLPGLALASVRHERQYSRLFRS